MEINRKPVIVVGGKQEQFIGIKIGEFMLVPDSDTGTRPEDLRVMGPDGRVLLISGGTSLLVENRHEGVVFGSCIEQLTQEECSVLRKMAWDLPGRTWPTADTDLKRKWEALGEPKILAALQHLFKVTKKRWFLAARR